MSTTLQLLVSFLAILCVLSDASGAGVYGIESGLELVQYDINSGKSTVIIQVGTDLFVFDVQLIAENEIVYY